MTMMFTEAVRSKSAMNIGIMGQTFTGKTYSALLLARGLAGDNGKIALVDCEGGRANLYAHVTKFDTLTLHPPYTPERYIEAIESAQAAGYAVVILDTISNEWSGEGGILNEQERITDRDPKRRWSCWADLTPRHTRFINTVIRSPIHIISTMRVKMQYVLDSVDGRNTPRKVGLTPIQRDNIEYEFPILLEMDASHMATVVKDMSGVFGTNGDVIRPKIEMGNALRVWIDEGIDIIPKEAEPEKPTAQPDHKKAYYDEGQIKMIKADYQECGWSQSIFTKARNADGLYDADMVKDDWKKRKEAAKPASIPVEKTREPVADTDDILCEACGTKITQATKDTSILFCNGAIYCDECRNKYKSGEFKSVKAAE